MKLWIKVLLFIALLAAAAAMYLKIGTRAANEGVNYIETNQGYLEDAKKSMDDLNRSIEKEKNAAGQLFKK